MIEQEEFLEVVSLLEDNYNKKLSDNIVGIWYEEFKSCSLSEFRKKVIECIKEYNYFPTINQVKSQEIYDTETTFQDECGRYKLTSNGKKIFN